MYTVYKNHTQRVSVSIDNQNVRIIGSFYSEK